MADTDLNLDVLIGTLKDTTEFNELKKKIGRLDKGQKPLSTPAARTTEERATRKVRAVEWLPHPASPPPVCATWSWLR